MELEVRNINPTDWITLILLGCFLTYTVARYLYPRRFDQFVLLPFTNKFFVVQGKDDHLRHPFYVMLFIAQIVTVSLFVFLLFKALTKPGADFGFLSYLQIASFYTAFVLVKIYLERIVGAAFGIDRLIGRYLFKKHSYRNFLGILVFAFILPVIYFTRPTPNVLLIVTTAILVFHVSSLVYTFRTFFGLIIPNIFYFILYLCALEIAPYVILYKALEYGGRL